jgi:thiosulfate dehydrogenase [quinone] large subunit
LRILDNPKFALRILQLYVGVAFFLHGLQKIFSWGWLQNPDMMTAIIRSGLPKVSPMFYRNFLIHVVLAHPLFWSRWISFSETAVGLGLLAGILPKIASLGGMLMMLSYWLMKGAPLDFVGLDQAYFFIFLICLLSAESWFVIRRK